MAVDTIVITSEMGLHQVKMSNDNQNSTESHRNGVWRPSLIISGGQTGSDFGGLQGAHAVDIATGGFAPAGFRTENGDKPSLGFLYGLLQLESPDYRARTEKNVSAADAVLLIARRFSSPGTSLTYKLSYSLHKPVFDIQYSNHFSSKRELYVSNMRKWLDCLQPDVLMIAGNRESRAAGIQEFTKQLIIDVFS